MAERVLFPDVVGLVLAHLNAVMPAIPTGTLVPSPRPARFVVAQRAGGNRTSLVTDAAVVIIEAWAEGPAQAADLAELCRSYVHALEGTTAQGTPIYRVDDVGAPGDQPDPLSDQPRYTFSVLVTLRGSVPLSS
jgi:hypothetical protein